MSAKRCVAINCPYLGIIPNGLNKGKLVCLTDANTQDGKGVLIDEIVEAGKLWNKTCSNKNKVYACSEWIDKECSQSHFSSFIRKLRSNI